MFRFASHRLISFASIVVAFLAFTGSAWAAVELNTADTSQLESVKGIGPGLSAKILSERKQGSFKDWSDFETRVSGVGEKNAAGFSRAGLTVGGRPKDNGQSGADASKAASKKAAPAAANQAIASSAKK